MTAARALRCVWNGRRWNDTPEPQGKDHPQFAGDRYLLVCDVLTSGISDPEPGESVSQGGAPIFAEDAVGVSHITAEQFDKGRLLFPGKRGEIDDGGLQKDLPGIPNG